MNTPITTFIFDCFGVICDPVLVGWYKEHRLKHGLVDENIKKLLEKYDLGILKEEDILQYFLSLDGVTSSRDELRREIDSFLKLDARLVEMIKKLREKGFKVLLLSNGNTGFYERKIYPTFPEFKTLFDEMIISSDVGMIKPNADIYLYTLEKANSKPEESLFVDDSQTNVDGAISLGINGFVYTDTNSFASYLTSLGIDLDK